MRILVICLVLTLFVGGCNSPGTYSVLGGGHGGPTDSANFTVESGKTTQQTMLEGHDSLFAFGATFIFNNEGLPSDTLDYPCPHGDYTDLGWRRDIPELGLFGKYGLEVIKDTGLFVTVLGGLSMADETRLARSRATGWYYEQDTKVNTYGMFGGGVTYFIKDKSFCVLVDYDNRRGFTAGIGKRF